MRCRVSRHCYGGPLANAAFSDDEHLERALRQGLRHMCGRGHCLARNAGSPRPPATVTSAKALTFWQGESPICI
jgi:hypothetical protein